MPKMSRASLAKYAEQGVRDTLRKMQDELNMLAKEFPAIVCNADGSVPSVLPITHKSPITKRADAGRPRRSRDDSHAMLRAFLTAHPGATTTAAAEHLGVVRTQAIKFLGEVGKPVKKHPRGSRHEYQWRVK